MSKLKSINPSDYSEVGTINTTTSDEILKITNSAKVSHLKWSKINLTKRIELLKDAFHKVYLVKEEVAILQSQEMGMPISQSLMDVESIFSYINWNFENVERILSPQSLIKDGNEHITYFEPIGVGAIVLPWNFPFTMIVWGCLQSLLAGNTVVVKHAEECVMTSKYISDIITRNLPKGVFNMIYGRKVEGEILLESGIDYISFTGSSNTGKKIFKKAGEKFVRTVMEMGGSAPCIISNNINVAEVAKKVCDNRFFNNGQTCDGIKRVIVHKDIHDSFIDELRNIVGNIKVGNALNKDTNIGPLPSRKQLNNVIRQVDESVNYGAKVEIGGKSLADELGGAFFEPTILSNVKISMPVMREEVFAPVIPVIAFSSIEEAIELANETDFGLGGYIFSNDENEINEILSNLNTSMISVNGSSYVKPFNFFGGRKKSGIGMEHGEEGYHELTLKKLVSKPFTNKG